MNVREINMLGRSCVLVQEHTEQTGVPPDGRCGGNLPDDTLLSCALCLDCDLLHQQGDRTLFTRIAARLTAASAAAAARQVSLDDEYAAIRAMLERLSLGDPDARMAIPEDTSILRGLEPSLSRIASFMKEQVDESHEVAIGLCEHYETLLKLASGELESRANTTSPVELIAKLGELINRQAVTFCKAIKSLNAKEQELVSQTRLHRGIIDFLPDATFVIDSEHRVIAWNKAMAELSGVAETDMLGRGDYAYSIAFYGVTRPLLIDLVGADLDVARQHYRKVEKRGETLIAEGSVPVASHGSERELWITASPLFDQAGSIIGAIESVRDVTAFKKAEEDRDLLKNQLHHAQKLDSIGQLAGGIAHEFNNILAAILGYAGILEKRLGTDSPNLMAVHRIISASEKAASLTHSMLTFSRKQVVALKQIELNSFICGMEEMLCRLAGENFQIDFHLDPEDLSLNADEGQLQQIVLNLYNNSRDAMPDGGRLTISTALRRISGNEADAPTGIPAGSYVQLSVADTGHGIPPDEMGRIFDPFFTTKEVGKGTGLGLSMLFGIVQQHGGFIKVFSRPGAGTLFSIWFPEDAGRGRRCADEAPPVAGQVESGSETILVGEDNEDVRPMIVEMLQDIGYRVLEARDGTEVVSLMEDFGDTVDLLLLDVIMPRMNGYEALSVVRRNYPELPCLFLSGYSDDVLKQKAKISGKFEYLSKPVMPDRLIAALRAALDGREPKSLSDCDGPAPPR